MSDFTRYHDGLRRLTYRQGHVHPRYFVDLDPDSLRFEFLEAARLGRQVIESYRDSPDQVDSGPVAEDVISSVGSHVGGDQFGSGNDSSGRILYHSADGAGDICPSRYY